jgi:DNA-binding transcriptional MerR regulator
MPRCSRSIARPLIAIAAALVLATPGGAAFAVGVGDGPGAAYAAPGTTAAWAGVATAAKPDKPGREKGDRGGDKSVGAEREGHPGALTDDQADDLAAELRECLTAEDVEDMRLGQVKRLTHAAGLSTHELKELLAGDDAAPRGLGRLVRGGLSEEQAGDVADELRDRLEAEDLERLKLGKVLQAAHACGITTEELRELLAED